MSEYINPVAEINRIDSGELVTPEQGLKHGQFFCPDYDCCDPDKILLLVVSKNKNPFFRHRANYSHDIRPETVLHKSAIKWFVGKKSYEIPGYNSDSFSIPKQRVELNDSKTICEFRRLQLIIPDVKLCTVNGFEFAAEIIVTNDLSDEKKKMIHQFGLPVLRVDLSKFYKKHQNECRTDLEFINCHLTSLMTDDNLKSWIIAPKQEEIETKIQVSTANEKAEADSSYLWWMAFFFFLLFCLTKRKPKPYTKVARRLLKRR